jgi:hypothetical protein
MLFNGTFVDYASSLGGTTTDLAANQIAVYAFNLPFRMTVSAITLFVSVADTSNQSNVGIYDTEGRYIADVGSQHFALGPQTLSLVGGAIILEAGTYLLAVTCADTTMMFAVSNPSYSMSNYKNVTTSSASGVLPSHIALTVGWDEGLAAPYQGFPPVMALSS